MSLKQLFLHFCPDSFTFKTFLQNKDLVCCAGSAGFELQVNTFLFTPIFHKFKIILMHTKDAPRGRLSGTVRTAIHR